MLYYRDFAALRRAQLGGIDRSSQARLARLRAARRPATDVAKPFAADAWALVRGLRAQSAATSAAASRRSRSRASATTTTRGSRSSKHGRSSGAPARIAAQREAVAAKLTAVVEAFDAWTPSIDDPDWGHAEALTALAADALERGQVRAGARSRRAGAAACAGVSRGASSYAPRCRARGRAIGRCNAQRERGCVLRRAGIRYALCDGAARTLRTARRAAARRPRARAAQRAREPPGALSDACGCCRRTRSSSSCRAARARPRSAPSSTSIGSGSKTRGASSQQCRPLRSEGLADAASSCARSGRAGDVEYRHDPRRPARCRVARHGARGCDAGCEAGAARTRRSEAGCSTRPTIISAPWLLRESQRRRPAAGATCRCGLQRTRWGSCSNSGTVSLNAALLFLEPAARALSVHSRALPFDRAESLAASSGPPSRATSPTTKRSTGGLTAAWHEIPLWAHPDARAERWRRSSSARSRIRPSS